MTMALALVRAMPGVRVVLLDRRPFSVPADQRASTIAAGVRRVLDSLDVWRSVAAEASPVRRMEITDSGVGDLSRPLFLSFAGDVAPGEPYAHLVPNRTLAAALLAALDGRVELRAPVQVASFTTQPGGGELGLADDSVVRAPLVIAADGQNSGLRAMAGIATIGHDYAQSGIVTTIAHALDHQGTAYEHFRPAGPFASLPLLDAEGRGRRSSLVWTESREAAAELKELALPQLGEAIEAAMGSCLGAVQVEEKPQIFPLRLQLARELVAPRLALIGDAAHVVHPIAGQGLNLGLKDVAALAEVVIEAMRLGLDHGGSETLERYQRWRRLDNAVMAMVTDGMNRLFSNDVAPVRALRDIGLGLVDRLPPLKQAMIGRAAGLEPGGPRLLAGRPI
jgi:2-octaprenyl-6-methoxyphenol hydroxylase